MTTTLAPLGGMAGLIAPARSNAQSESAKELSRMRDDIRKHLLSSYVIGNASEEAAARLDDLRLEASQVGWDGYGALPVSQLAYFFARLFLNTLPTTAPLPDVSADPDGEVALDWHFGERRALTVSIGPTGRCTFAWMIGQSTHRGTDWIDDEIPASIIFALGQLARTGTQKQTP